MDTIMIVFGILCVVIILFLIIRNIVLWYLKINERIELQERANYLLEKILKQLGGEVDSD